MKKVLSLQVSLIVVFVLTLGSYLPGRAASQTAVMPARTINIAHFYKPPNMDASVAASTFGTIVLTNGDESYRRQLEANGFSSTIPEYFRAEAIQDPGSCTALPLNNQVAYHPGDFCSISASHPDWFLLDSSGRRITVSDSPGYYRMDPSNPGWREFFLSRVIESQDQHGWSGLFLDNVEASLGKFSGTQIAKYPDNLSYQNAVAGFLQYLHINYAQKYGRPIVGNVVTLPSYGVWFNYLQYLDGGLLERFAVNWQETEYLSVSEWEEDLAAIEKTQTNGKYAILVAPGYQPDLNRQTFAFASYLLISNGRSAFRYSTDDEYRNVWLYDNYKVNLGTPLGPRYRAGTSWRRDFSNGYVIVDPVNHVGAITVIPADSDVKVFIGGRAVGGYSPSPASVVTDAYGGILNGPVQVVGKSSIVASERIYTGQGYVNETMGIPNNQLTTQYWFPWYDNISMRSWILVGNPSSSSTAHVTIYIAGKNVGSYDVPPGGRITPHYAVQDGPVRVVSNISVLASERVHNGKGFVNELNGFPNNQLNTQYWFPWYDNISMQSWILIGNPGSTTAHVTVYIAGNKMDSYDIPPHGRITPRYPVQDGPVRIVSDVNVFASERVHTGQGFVNETMGIPNNQLANEFWFPWYDNTSMQTWLLIGNPSSSGTAHVTVYIAGNNMGRYDIPPGGRVTPQYGQVNGPVRLVSDIKIFASERVHTGQGFVDEAMGLPADQLTDQFWFSWYDNVSMRSNILIGQP